MNYITVKIEPDEYDTICCDLIDIALTVAEKDCRVILRILQLLLHGKWTKEGGE